MPTAIVPGIYDDKLAHDNLWLETEDAHAMARRMGREQGLLVGVSSGANVHAAWTLGQQLNEQGEEAVIVTILCDGASKYLSDNFWNE